MLLALVGCAASAPSPQPSSSLASSPPTPSATAPRLTWSDCGDGLECTTLAVPRDYGAPAGPQLNLSVIRLRATDTAQRIGALVTNPGGPGASGVDFVREGATQVFSAALRARFDIVGFDPRGVGLSTPVRCQADLPGFLGADPDPRTAAQRQGLLAADRAFAEACGRNAGELLAAVTTENAARDLERLRAALGDERLTYVGFSYGTFLGAAYAAAFPQHVRALVLDAAVDPSLDLAGRLAGQAASFEGALDRFLADCARRPACTFHQGGRPAQAFERIVAGLQRAPLPAIAVGGGRTATESSAWTAILGALYTPGFGWPYLAEALQLAAQGDGSLLLAASDALEGRKPDGEYTNLVEANTAIDCADEPGPSDPAAFDRLAAQLAAPAPRVGRVLAYSGLICATWPVRSMRRPARLAIGGLPPVVVVGATGDPATPYAWAVSLAKQLGSGVLLTRRGEGHTSYGRGDTCIDGAVDAYLLRLAPPKAGTVCG